jgi:hypothetical protein
MRNARCVTCDIRVPISVGTSCGNPNPSPSARPSSPHALPPHVNSSPLAVRHTLSPSSLRKKDMHSKTKSDAAPVARACSNGNDVFLLQVWDGFKTDSVAARLHPQLPLSIATAAEYGARLRHCQRVLVTGKRIKQLWL